MVVKDMVITYPLYVKKSQLKIKDDYRAGTDNSNNDLPIGI